MVWWTSRRACALITNPDRRRASSRTGSRPPGTHDTGLVRLERQQWRAETDSDALIPAGSQVEVISIRGTRLVVAPVRPAAPVEQE